MSGNIDLAVFDTSHGVGWRIPLSECRDTFGMSSDTYYPVTEHPQRISHFPVSIDICYYIPST